MFYKMFRLQPASRLVPSLRLNHFEITSSRYLSKITEPQTNTTPPRTVYMDLQATTPIDPRVFYEMLPYMTHAYGNPHSKTHEYGWESARALEKARTEVADLINADPREIVFTSGATESNNTALKGVARFYKAKKNHIITLRTEHKCVLDSCRSLQSEGFDVTYLPVGKNGIVNLKDLEEAIKPETVLVTVMFVNNEIGVIQPIKEIGEICRKHKVFFHTDAAQALGKVLIDVNELNIDMMSISGHKIYGPKGIGALYVRRRPRVRIDPIINGGGQERGMRSGTMPTFLAVGLGAACSLAKREYDYDSKHIKYLSDKLVHGISSRIPHTVRNGAEDMSYPGCVNFSFAYVEGESLLMALKDIALSSGSACTSASLEPSYVLRAIGTDPLLSHSSIRFGIGRFTSEKEIDFVIDRITHAVEKLRAMSPLWDLANKGVDISKIKWQEH